MLAGRGSGGALRRLAPAKINLALHLTGRRPDGYHAIDTIAVFADIGDTMEVAPAGALELSLGGPFAEQTPSGPDNLAWRAAVLLQQAAGAVQGARIDIDKAIPLGAGLGGGSSDAAAALLALNALWRTCLDRDQLAALALKLGADLPMCLHGRGLRARGVGEAITPLPPLPALPLVLVWPGVALDTGRVFAALHGPDNPPLPDLPQRFSGAADMAGWLGECRNDLEPPAIGLAPVIAEALSALRAQDGCLLARMSGAGSACFGLFAAPAEAQAAATAIAAVRPGWWVRATVAA